MQCTHPLAACSMGVAITLFLAGCGDRQAPPNTAPGEPTTRSSPVRPVPVKVASQAPTPGAPPVDDASVAVLREALASEDWSTRIIAVETIGEIRAAGLVPWIETTLGDPEHDVRMAAVEALGEIPGEVSARLLRSVRDDTTEELDIRAIAASALLVRSRR